MEQEPELPFPFFYCSEVTSSVYYLKEAPRCSLPKTNREQRLWARFDEFKVLETSSFKEVPKEETSCCLLGKFRRQEGIPFHLKIGLSYLMLDQIHSFGINRITWDIRDKESVFCFSTLRGYFRSSDAQTVFTKYPCNVWKESEPIICTEFQFQAL